MSQAPTKRSFTSGNPIQQDTGQQDTGWAGGLYMCQGQPAMDREDRHLDTETDNHSGTVHVQLPSGAGPWIQPMTQSPLETPEGLSWLVMASIQGRKQYPASQEKPSIITNMIINR